MLLLQIHSPQSGKKYSISLCKLRHSYLNHVYQNSEDIHPQTRPATFCLTSVRLSHLCCLCIITPHTISFILQTLPTWWTGWQPFTWPPNSPAGNAFFHYPSQDQPTRLEAGNYTTALSFMQVLPEKLLLSKAPKWQNKTNEKEGWSTGFFHFKSPCVHKTKLTGSLVSCQDFK